MTAYRMPALTASPAANMADFFAANPGFEGAIRAADQRALTGAAHFGKMRVSFRYDAIYVMTTADYKGMEEVGFRVALTGEVVRSAGQHLGRQFPKKGENLWNLATRIGGRG